jgi:transcriptional regulator with XRE-family HTH domain
VNKLLFMSNEIFLGKNIKHLRLKKNISQAKLGALLNKSKETINGYERARSYPSFLALLTIADYFEMSLDNLVYTDLSQEGVEVSGNVVQIMKEEFSEMEELLRLLEQRIRKLEED